MKEEEKLTENQMIDIKKMLIIRKVYSKYISERSKESKLTPAFAVFVTALDGHDFNSQQELSEYIGCNKAHTSRMIIKLQLKGLVKLCAKTITLTERGKEYAKEIESYKQDFLTVLMKDIPQKEQKTFANVLNKILENAKSLA